MKFYISLFVVAALGAVWFIEVRPFLVRQASTAAAMGRLTAAEMAWWKGSRTITCAAIAAIAGVLPDLINGLTGIDLTALGMPEWLAKGVGAGAALAAIVFRTKA